LRLTGSSPATPATCAAGTFTSDGGHLHSRLDTRQVHDRRVEFEGEKEDNAWDDEIDDFETESSCDLGDLSDLKDLGI
jgi:hypothetical protein